MCVLTYDDIQKKNAVKKKKLTFQNNLLVANYSQKNYQYMGNSMVSQYQIKTK